MTTLIDLYRSVYSLCKRYRVCSSDMAVLFVLIGEWNEQRRPAEPFISKQALLQLSSLPDTTVRRSLQKLLSWRLIRTEKINGQVVIGFRPQADWRDGGGKAADERHSKTESRNTGVQACATTPEVKEECAREEEEMFDPAILEKFIQERRTRKCPETNTPRQSR